MVVVVVVVEIKRYTHRKVAQLSNRRRFGDSASLTVTLRTLSVLGVYKVATVALLLLT